MSEEEKIQDNDKVIGEVDNTITSEQHSDAKPLDEILIPQVEPLTMEVHHHGHVHEQKKWKEYVFQFIMLFLAVFCGFLAEYQLEHTIEKERGKQYVRSFYNDLHNDTSLITLGINRAQRVALRIDSAINILQAGNFDNSSVEELYILNLSYLNGLDVRLTDRTSLQLKNAGGMRLISDGAIIEKILDYWKNEGLIEIIEQDISQKRTRAREQSYLIFDSKYYSSSRDIGPGVLIGTPTLMTKQYHVLAEFSNRLNHLKNLVLNTYIPSLNAQLHAANEMISLIRKEHKLK